jgi:phosphatidylserine/phosphatidylglycerophosphate/cardiolipin synthase-like enzyme
MATTNESHSGDSSYKYVDMLIANDDPELLIVSPYVGGYYTRMLVKKAGRKRIRLITTESSLSYKDSSLGKYASKGIAGMVKAAMFVLLLDAISVFLKFNYTTMILSAILLALVVAAYMKYRKINTNMRVKIAKGRFVHEKLYIGKDTAIVGSANLTYNGMHRNVEHIDVIRDAKRIRELRRHFESLWKSD